MFYLRLSLRICGPWINYGYSNVAGESSRGSRSKSSSGSVSSHYSARSLNLIMEKLKSANNRESTKKTYLAVWRKFNNFVIRLDIRPASWEERTAMFLAHLFENGYQSSTLRSYISAIKRILQDDGYVWRDNLVLLSTLTRGCRLINDKVRVRLPIQCALLELILFEVQRYFVRKNQPFLMKLYKAMFALGYYGLFRVGELTASQHVIKAKNVHLALNEDKLLVVLLSSKTHGKESYPQKVKIVANKDGKFGQQHKFFCPFQLLHDYLVERGLFFDEDGEQLFVFGDYTPVTTNHARQILRTMLKNMGLDECLYDMHSLRIGRASDMIKFGASIEEVKMAGRWRSSCVYKYIRN